MARAPKNVVNVGLDADTKMGLYAYASYQHVDLAYLTFSNSNRVLPYDLVSAKLGWQKHLGQRWFVDASVGGDNLLNSTYYEYIFVGPTYAGLAQPPNGTGDGTIIPGSYNATFYGGARLTWTF